MNNPSVFISYSWDSPEHKDWVVALANQLRKNGIVAIIDEFITQKETINMNRMMIENIRDNDFTIVVLTDKYAEKADSYSGGVGTETGLLTNYLSQNLNKIIPIIRYKGNKSRAIPFYLKGVSYIDLSDDQSFNINLEELIYKILKIDRIEMEPIGELPTLKPRKITKDTLPKDIISNDDLIPNLRVITDIDKNKFMKKSYSEILDCLSAFAQQTKTKNSNFDYDIDIITNKKAIIRYYLSGMEKHSIKILLGSNFSREENIFLSYGNSMLGDDNSFNEMIICEVDNKNNLHLKMTMDFYGDKEANNAEDIAKETWKKIIQYLK